MCMRMDSFQSKSLVRKDLLAETRILHVCLHCDSTFFLTPLPKLFGEVLSTFKGSTGRNSETLSGENVFSLGFLLLDVKHTEDP